MKTPPLPLEVHDSAVDIIRRMETLCGILEAAAVSSLDVDPSIMAEAVHLIGGEAARLRQVLQLGPRSRK